MIRPCGGPLPARWGGNPATVEKRGRATGESR